MMNPAGQQGFDPNQNPFAEIMQRMGSGAPQGGGMSPEMGGMPAGMPSVGGPMGGGSPMPPEMGGMPDDSGQLEEGKNPDKSGPLLSAVQQLENFIKLSTDRDEIQTARGIISLLVRLIRRDQEIMSSRL
jgi:hypothetical protein